MVVPDGPNQRWSLDFVSDAFTDGRRFRILAVVYDHTRDPTFKGRLGLLRHPPVDPFQQHRQLRSAYTDLTGPFAAVPDKPFLFSSRLLNRHAPC